jgi:hypothetical protein
MAKLKMPSVVWKINMHSRNPKLPNADDMQISVDFTSHRENIRKIVFSRPLNDVKILDTDWH